MRRLRRLRRPCEVNCVSEFTDADLMYSPAIRRFGEVVVNAALRSRKDRDDASRVEQEGDKRGRDFGSYYDGEQQRVHVFRVRVHGNKLAVEGEMTNGLFFRVPFRYDISLSVSGDGHILYLKDPNIYWGTSGGHVPLPMLPQQTFTIDLGDRLARQK